MRLYALPLFAAMTCLLTSLVSMSSPVSAESEITKSTDPSGTWHWTQDYGQGDVNNWLILKTDDKALTGTYRSEEKETPIKEGKIEDGKFSFKLELEHNDKPLHVACNGKVDGDKMTATSSIEFKGDTTDLEFTAARATRSEDVVGNWELRIETDNRTFTPVLEVTLKDGKLVANYNAEEAGNHPVDKIELKDNELQFDIAFDADGTKVDLKYKGAPRSDSIAGDLQYEFSSYSGTTQFTGKRKAKPRKE